MKLSTADKKLRRALDDKRERTKLFGEDMAKKLKLRLDALDGADSLADFWPPFSGPERCHELKADRIGTFSMDVKQPYRLLFKPADEATANLEGLARWSAIRAVELLGVEDTHG